MTKFCSVCGTELTKQGSSTFCKKCSVFCSKCGTKNASKAEYCENCGTHLVEGNASQLNNLKSKEKALNCIHLKEKDIVKTNSLWRTYCIINVILGLGCLIISFYFLILLISAIWTLQIPSVLIFGICFVGSAYLVYSPLNNFNYILSG